MWPVIAPATGRFGPSTATGLSGVRSTAWRPADVWHDAATEPAAETVGAGAVPPAGSEPPRDSETTVAISPETRATPRKMRVSVAGRTRVIAISNKHDVTETVHDLITAAKRKPQKYGG